MILALKAVSCFCVCALASATGYSITLHGKHFSNTIRKKVGVVVISDELRNEWCRTGFWTSKNIILLRTSKIERKSWTQPPNVESKSENQLYIFTFQFPLLSYFLIELCERKRSKQRQLCYNSQANWVWNWRW